MKKEVNKAKLLLSIGIPLSLMDFLHLSLGVEQFDYGSLPSEVATSLR